MKRTSKYIYPIVILVSLLVGGASCERKFSALPNEENSMMPNTDNLVLTSDSSRIVKSIAYIDALEFSLAEKEIKEITDKAVRDSLQVEIDELQAFADNYLLFTINDLGKKKYIWGQSRIQQYRKQGYLDDIQESRSANLENIIQDDVIAFFNFQAFPRLKRLTIKGANADYINFSGLDALIELNIRKARKNTVIDLSEQTGELHFIVDSVTNIQLKTNPDLDIHFSSSESYFKSFAELKLQNLITLGLHNVKFQDNTLFSKENPNLWRMNIVFGGKSFTDEEGITYNPLSIDDNFIESINQYAFNLKDFIFKFNNIELFENANFSELSLPKIEEMNFYVMSGKSGQDALNLQESFSLIFDKCPNLKKINLGSAKNAGAVYAKTLDLSQLNNQNMPNLEQIQVKGYFEKLILPDNSNQLTIKIKARNLKEIVIPKNARKRQILNFSDFYDFSGFKVEKDLALDWEYLRKNLKGVTGYLNPTPPSAYKPYSDTEEIYFTSNILDFSGEQWRDFSGTIHFALGKSDNTQIPISYVDFGYLRASNFSNALIRLPKKCEVKNVPSGIVIQRR